MRKHVHEADSRGDVPEVIGHIDDSLFRRGFARIGFCGGSSGRCGGGGGGASGCGAASAAVLGLSNDEEVLHRGQGDSGQKDLRRYHVGVTQD